MDSKPDNPETAHQKRGKTSTLGVASRSVLKRSRSALTWLRGHIKAYLKSQKYELVTALVIGLLLAVFAFFMTWRLETQHFERQQVLENTRFARQLSLTGDSTSPNESTPPRPSDSLPLSGLSFVEAELNGLDLSGADLSHADLTDANLSWGTFNGAKLFDATLTGASLTGSSFSDANILGADFTGANLTYTFLDGAHLNDANFTGADLTGAVLTGAHLVNADFTGANLTNVTFLYADLTGADFTGADLTGTYFGEE